MSKRFNPLSASVAAVTASLILGVTGCAMSTNPASNDQTDSAGLSRESTDNSQAAPAVAQADTTALPSTATDMPATASGQWVEPAPSPTTVANDTAVIPPADQSTAIATPAYPSTTTASTDMTTTTTTPAMEAPAAPAPTSEETLPPRSDRN